MAVINFISCLLLSACLLVVSNVDALQPQKIYKVGRLSAGSPKDPLTNATYDAFRGGLRDLGWIEGSTIILENRWAGEPSANAVDLAAELGCSGLRRQSCTAGTQHHRPEYAFYRAERQTVRAAQRDGC